MAWLRGVRFPRDQDRCSRSDPHQHVPSLKARRDGALTEPEEPKCGDEDDLLLRLREELAIPAVVHHDAGQPPDRQRFEVSMLADFGERGLTG